MLANDTDIDGGPKTITVGDATGQRHRGRDRRRRHGLTYKPDANYCNAEPADDTSPTPLNGGSTATVSVTVTCVDDTPVAVNDTRP